MLKTIEGIYREGKIELTEMPVGMPDPARVIVTFLDSGYIDLQSRGIDEKQAADLRARLGTFEDWETPEMDLYNDYDSAKSQTG
ncbi:MAG: hypothetical protein O2954_12980 [bacterium]|nr:hypothetical protein [bacterium]